MHGAPQSLGSDLRLIVTCSSHLQQRRRSNVYTNHVGYPLVHDASAVVGVFSQSVEPPCPFLWSAVLHRERSSSHKRKGDSHETERSNKRRHHSPHSSSRDRDRDQSEGRNRRRYRDFSERHSRHHSYEPRSVSPRSREPKGRHEHEHEKR